MRVLFICMIILNSLNIACSQQEKDVSVSQEKEGTIYKYNVKDIDGNDQTLADYRSKIVLIVNVASKCGFTP